MCAVQQRGNHHGIHVSLAYCQNYEYQQNNPLSTIFMCFSVQSLELLLRGKGLELEQVCEAWRNSQSVHREREESHMRSLRERDALISQLQTSLHTRTKEAEVNTSF